MKELFTADSHFGHANILKYTERKFSSMEEMREVFIEAWNSVVEDCDTVYHLGDFLFCNKQEAIDICNRLKGNIYFIPGNHDARTLSIRQKLMNKNELTNNQRTTMIKGVHLNGERLNLCHYPLASWNGSYHGSWHLHGHSHGRCARIPGRLDVGVDNAKVLLGEYRPFTFEEVRNEMEIAESYYSIIREDEKTVNKKENK